MKPPDFVHLALYALGGEIQGKTNLQKKIYFLILLMDRVDELGYRPHFYGPYSDDVALAVENLKTVGFVDQNVVSGFATNDFGFERRRYDYRLTDASRGVAEAKARQNPKLWGDLQKAVKRLKQAGELDYMKLSVAAKTFFLLGKRKNRATKQELARLAPRFGWHVTAEEIEQAAQYLERLGLVKVVKD